MIYYKKKIQQDAGATAIEYGLLAFLISVGIITAIYSLGSNLSNTYCNVSYALGSKSCDGNTNPADLSLADKLQNSLSDKLDLSYFDVSQGGTGYWVNCPWSPNVAVPITSLPGYMQNIANELETLNSKDPITNVFGIYDRSGKPINDYATALAGFQSDSNPQDFWTDSSDLTISPMGSLPHQSLSEQQVVSGEKFTYFADGVEVTTQSGKVYHIDQTGNATEQPHK